MRGELKRRILDYAGDVVNTHGMIHKDKSQTFYVGRGSAYGNTYRIEVHGRDECVQKFLNDLVIMEQSMMKKWLLPVARAMKAGRKLRCFCAPKLCHGMVLAMWVRKHPAFAFVWAENTPEQRG